MRGVFSPSHGVPIGKIKPVCMSCLEKGRMIICFSVFWLLVLGRCILYISIWVRRDFWFVFFFICSLRVMWFYLRVPMFTVILLVVDCNRMIF